MDYIKKNKYPNLKTGGVYPDIDDNKMVGLDNDELEKFSLGNWNSIVKTNRVFTSNHLTKFTATYDDEQAIEEIPITFLPFSIPYGGGGQFDAQPLSNRFFVEFYGWYLDTSILHEAGFHITGEEIIGEITIPPTSWNIEGLPNLEGTFDTYTPKLPSGFLYFKEDVITKNILHPFGIDLTTFFETIENVVGGDFLGSEGIGASEDIDLNISNNWNELVNSGVVSQEYADAFKSAFKFHNWSYEVHNEINRGGMSSEDVYQHFPTVTTYEEGYRWSNGFNQYNAITSGAQLGNFFPIDLDEHDDLTNPFNTLDGTQAYIEKLNGERQRLKNLSWNQGGGNTPDNPITFCDVNDPEATSQITSGNRTFGIFDGDNGTEYDIGQPHLISYMEAAGTQIRLWLLTNTFFIKENPNGSETYGVFGEGNPIKISFSQTNEEELNQLLNYSLVVDDCILDPEICNFSPEGLNNLTYYGKDFELENGQTQKYTSNYANQSSVSNPNIQSYTDRTSCSMRITPIFDRPKKYYGINKVYITPTEYLPDNYESNPQVPSKFIIEQHPEGNKFFDLFTYSNSYNSEVGVEYPYGHLFGKNAFSTTGDPPGVLDFNGLYVDQDFYRRPSYTALLPLTFDQIETVLAIESDLNYEDMTVQLLLKVILVIDDRDEERNDDGLITFNAYLPNLIDGMINQNGENMPSPTNVSDISYSAVGGPGWDESVRHDYLINTLGWPEMTWPPILESGEEADINTILDLTKQYNTLVSSLTTLENNSDWPSGATESGFLSSDSFGQKLVIGDYDVSDVDFIVDTFFATNVGDTISRNNSGVEIKSRFLYYDESDLEFVNSSYPIKLNLVIGLLDYDDFNNEEKIIDLDELEEAREDIIAIQDDSPLSNYFRNTIEDAASSPEKSIYRAQVIQWGDEETLLDDDAILNSYFFSMYQQEEWPSIFNYGYKKHRSDQENNARPIMYVDNNGDTIFNVFSHNYTTPGTKSIKIIVYRYNSDYTFLIGTSLVTKNVVINDGLITAQDYTVQGGTNFNFLPLKSKSLLVNSGSDFLELDIPKEAILGGLNKESEYNASVNQIKKDDNFVEEDYLLRSSVNQYVDKMQINFYGESINNSDLSQFRFFNKPKTIYDFIGGNKLEWITIGSGSLPLNSLATDIFISDDNCLIDLNPTDVVYSTIQNKAGIDGKGILIGDFKLNQPEDGLIEQETLMDLPKVNSETNKQAF